MSDKALAPWEQNDWQTFLMGDGIQRQLATLGAQVVGPMRLVRIMLTQFRRNPALLCCTPESIMASLFRVAELDLEPDGQLIALVPFKRECTVIVGYRGYVALVMRSGRIVACEARLVYPSDEFDLNYGNPNPIHHKPNLRRSVGEEPYGAWAAGWLVTGGLQHAHVDYMTIEEIDAIRQKAPGFAKPESPHQKYPDEMRKKTVFRRCAKMLPQVKVGPVFTYDENPTPATRDDVPPVAMQLYEQTRDRKTIVGATISGGLPKPELQQPQDMEAVKDTSMDAPAAADNEGVDRGTSTMPMPEPRGPIEAAPVSSAPPSPDQAPAVSGGIGIEHPTYQAIRTILAHGQVLPERRKQAAEQFALNHYADVAKLDAETAGELLAFLREGVIDDSGRKETAM